MEEGTRTAAKVSAFVLLLFGLWCLTGCLGPTTPLGAVDRSAERPEAPLPPPTPPPQPPPPVPPLGAAEEPARILFSPSYQQVHGPYTWTVQVLDPSAQDRPDAGRLRVFYNGLEVTKSALFQFRVDYCRAGEGDREALLLEMSHLRLRPLDDHEIVVEYTTARGTPLSAPYPFPAVRDLGAQEAVATTGPFSVDPAVLEAVYGASSHFRLNPVLLAALIAQESSFDPYAVSRARALGLTQITHLAERDIVRAFPEWPRYPGIEGLSRKSLRRLIPHVVNGRNEWRLDPVKSVWGGAYFLSHLRARLNHERNRPAVALGGQDEERVLAEAALAAYNSGLSRTLHWLSRHREGWLDQDRAREAKRYVRKIFSYYGAFRAEQAPTATEGT